ncbi:Serine/threonine-protein kinase STE7 [Suhomyces tanzawaensis NRRL Y-17324]|uniref:Serine/threonine-protein kinase STE7 n=1 Tax=Suhomyces tanzawaensis NRRL Y-17324 TaxID=984487 RepID=A0A1E4SKB7_9ASCO|nr:Serine/threonine-protein kinase STE7 [Suhomyces tanzawaensis NRRL Y-17324]ODV79944.1 Serine/threonine-protein kinase STE7 [Suhomyces tanzawaensis NRRL Y-17324]
MMRLNNNSLSSLGSNKDKQLPPIPSPVPTSPYPSSPLAASNARRTAKDGSKDLLQAKTLRRKNFKKLSLDASPVKESKPIDDSENILNLKTTSLRQKRFNMRPAPVLNLNIDTTSSSTRIVPQTLTSLNINDSNRNIDPDSQTSHNIIIDELSNMELATMKDAAPKLPVHRKRQTVISSISPTKSTATSPSDAKSTSDIFTETLSPIATTSSLKLNNNDIVTLKSLGAGNSGTVSKILHVPTQKIMAKKIIHIDLKTVIKTQIIRELRILHECQSPYIIEFYGAFVNNNNTIVICMEYCNCSSLDKISQLCDGRQFPLYLLKKVAYAILSGLTYLYTAHKIIHRDIKPSNVLMTHKGEFKLCDFGVSRELTNSLAMADTFVGTSTYMSPERIQGLNYGVKSDVWSMGLMLVELASGSPVWSEDDDADKSLAGNGGPEGILDLLQRIVNETPPTLTNRTNPLTKGPFDPSLCAFIDSCLIKNDSVRKSPWDLLQEENGFISGVAEGVYDKDVKSWAKKIRKLHKDKTEGEK